jgi:polar amino acid transport system ATP-binding protein
MMIDIIDVEKYYGGACALRCINISVAKGEVVALVGPSGSGKSTLLRCINDLESIDAGEIRVDANLIGYECRNGRLVHQPDRRAAKHRAEVGMVFQSFNLFPHMTAIQNVMIAPLHVRRISKAQAREEAAELLRRVRLAEKTDAYPGELSGGQQQRVAIARALAMKPKVMLFDEPTSALDPETINEVLDVVRELANSGMTMMIVTHEMAFAREVADRVIFMSDGGIVEQAPAEQFFTEPASEQSRAFLGSLLRRPGKRAAAAMPVGGLLTA